jgi:hypothetical protein
MRLRSVALVALGCVMIAGCGSGLPAGTGAHAARPVTSAAATVQDVWLAVLSGRAAVVGVAGPRHVLASTADGGAFWSVRPSPAWPARRAPGHCPTRMAA